VRGILVNRFLITIILCILFSFFTHSAHALDVPKVQGYVNDYADMISPSVKAELENELKTFEQTDSTQIVILTIPSLEGEEIEDFGIKVGDTWKIGQAGKDNGIIFIVAKQDRKMRIEVGRGIEGRLTDLMAGRIIDLVVKPRFKRGDFDGGFVAGVSSLIDATRGEFKADGNHGSHQYDSSSRFVTLLIFGAIVILVFGSISRILGGLAGAIGLPVLAYVAASSIGFVWLIILALLGLISGLLLPILFSSSGYRRGGGLWSGGGYYGSGGGGGFSGGGGGGFGGGGASGGW